MDRLFRIDFYPQDWLALTSAMTLEQRGIFIQICAMIYANRGPIKNDPAWIGRAANCSPRMARSLIDQLVASDSIQIQGSQISQKRCERELNSKRIHLENSANGGRKSAENRGKGSKTSYLQPSDEADSLSTSSPSPTASAKIYNNGATHGKPRTVDEALAQFEEQQRSEATKLDA
jgi:uncharacterized protein YdaU (DUF1376 family)